MNKDFILSTVSILPFKIYLLFPSNTYLVITTLSSYIKPGGDIFLLVLSNIIVTYAFVIPELPYLYINSCKLQTLTCYNEEIPRTKQMASMTLDLPLPFNPVIALNYESKFYN